MTSQNSEAEQLMKKIEKEEEDSLYIAEQDNKKQFHLCIVNLVIGTLYCAKGNYEFGISRVMKSLEPYSKKLGTDTWYYAKRCFLSLLEQLTKQLVVLNDNTLQDCIQFFEHCERNFFFIWSNIKKKLFFFKLININFFHSLWKGHTDGFRADFGRSGDTVNANDQTKRNCHLWS